MNICPLNDRSAGASAYSTPSSITIFLRHPVEGLEVVRFVSSANSRGLVLLRHSGKSLIYNKKSNGPKIEPCGTPHLIKCSEEKKLPI